MAYNKFKRLEQLQTEFGITAIQANWLPQALPLFTLTPIFVTLLQEVAIEALDTEKSKSEHIINPVLKELRRHNANSFKYFSGYEFNVDSLQGLNGYCDFILSAHGQQLEITAPVFCLVEAKNAEIAKGYAQCGAEMYAAQLFNERKGNPQKIIYGCVTNAFSWCFLKLEGKTLYIDTNYIPLTFTKPHEVLAVLQWILDVSLAAKT
jgi:hypothetical protein